MVRRRYIVLGDRTSHGGYVTSARGEGRMTYCGKPVACVGDIVSCPKCKGTHRILEGAMNPPDSLDGVLKAVEGCRVSCGAVLISVGQDIGFYDGELGLDAASYKTLQAEGIERKKAAEAEAAARKAAAPIDHAHGAMNLAVAEGANVTEEERAVLSELTYVEFQLLDDESIAIPNEFFDLVLADGSSRNGQLDKKGFVRIDGVVRGRCQIKFSRLGYIKVL